MVLKVFKLAPLSFVLYPFAFIAAGIVTLLAWFPFCIIIATWSMITGKNNVSGPLSYFYTHNASLDGGVEQNIRGYDPNAKGFKLWWQRVCWIRRNAGYKFNAYPMGFSGDGAEVIYRSGSEYPDFDLWTVVKSKNGWKFFGYRNNRTWIGWNYTTYGGRHQIKIKPFSFKD